MTSTLLYPARFTLIFTLPSTPPSLLVTHVSSPHPHPHDRYSLQDRGHYAAGRDDQERHRRQPHIVKAPSSTWVGLNYISETRGGGRLGRARGGRGRGGRAGLRRVVV
eukprot:scaffold25798_cov48-Phaeocystis_antarctica.AAC.2